MMFSQIIFMIRKVFEDKDYYEGNKENGNLQAFLLLFPFFFFHTEDIIYSSFNPCPAE